MKNKILKQLVQGMNLQKCMISTNLSYKLRSRYFNILFFDSPTNKASAILLSFFMMTLLLLGSLGVSFLVIRDTATVRTIVSGVQSEYAAEGLAEMGLYGVAENLPGYEPSMEDYAFKNNSVASLASDARGSSLPCLGDEDAWLSLGENESMQVALFAQIEDEVDVYDTDIVDIDNFYVEFYVGDEDGNVHFPSQQDVLRWKILGMSGRTTEAISEYIPLGYGRSTLENPSLFGPGVGDATLDKYTKGKFYKDMGVDYVFYPAYSIDTFLQEHNYNYLVLTNVIQGGTDKYIYFRLVSNTNEAVCEYVQLASFGSTEFGSTQKSLETYVREGENLPVFDFVLYHTDNDGSEEEEESSGIGVASKFGEYLPVNSGEYSFADFFPRSFE